MSRMTIGGKIPATVLEEFLVTARVADAKVGGFDGPDFRARTAKELRTILDQGGHLQLAAGRFAEMEDFCVMHDIPFDRYDGDGNVSFRAGMRGPERLSLDRCEEALLDAGNIRPVARELAALVTVKLNKKKVLETVVKVIRRLNALLPPELPPLEIEE